MSIEREVALSLTSHELREVKIALTKHVKDIDVRRPATLTPCVEAQWEIRVRRKRMLETLRQRVMLLLDTMEAPLDKN